MLKRNIIANFLGQGWTALMAIAFVPLYIKYLGIEAYGLIGIYTLVQAWLVLLDMGMTPTISREMARFRAGGVGVTHILNLIRSIEYICILMAFLIVTSGILLAPSIANNWLNVESLSTDSVIQSIIMIGLVIATRLLEEVYKGALRGSQEHIWLNVMQVILATLRWAGALLLITFIAPTVQLFFAWQVLISVISIALYNRKTYRLLPYSNNRRKFGLSALHSISNFAGGMMAITFLALLLTQVDKILLSGLLTLEGFGYYVLASVVASGLAQLFTPINVSVYPKFTELITNNNQALLIKNYHDTCQLMSVVVVPIALVLIFFSKSILFIWTADLNLSTTVAPILSLLVFGTLFNSFMNVPYMLQLAYGWTGFAIRVNLIAVFAIIPAILWFVPIYGAIGAAWIWALLNFSYVLIGIQFMYRKLLPEEKWKWYMDSVIKPLCAGLLTTYILGFLIPIPAGRLQAIFVVLVLMFVVSVVVIFSTPLYRFRVINLLRKKYG